jgi:hypothetical protein
MSWDIRLFKSVRSVRGNLLLLNTLRRGKTLTIRVSVSRKTQDHREDSNFMKKKPKVVIAAARGAFRVIISLVTILLVTTICSASRISGTYVAHGADFAEMLQLAQTDNGQLSGVFTSVQLKPEGNITSDQTSVTGVIDAAQLTLSVRSDLLQFLGAGSVAGIVRENTIQLQAVDSKGNVAPSIFVRGTPECSSQGETVIS